MSEENKALIEQFYSSFQKTDAETMTSCYSDNILFEDPAFGILKGDKAKNMWRMLCSRSKDLEIEFTDVEANDHSGSAHWEARYTFDKTGRKVHNIIKASFKFENGKIIEHRDDFNLHKCASQVLGLKGMLLGGTNFFKKKLQSQTNYLLRKFESKD